MIVMRTLRTAAAGVVELSEDEQQMLAVVDSA